MAKIARKTQKIFGSNASNNGQIGSAQTGTKVLSNDLDILQQLTAFVNGLNDVTISGQKLIPLEELQSLNYISTTQLAYLFQEGIPEFDNTLATEYYQNGIVKKPGTYELYGSKIDNNIGNALPSQADDANWQYLGQLSDLANLSALPKGYIDDVITYQTSTTIDWYGECRSDDNTTDLSVPQVSAITGTLSGASINTVYYMFVGQDAGLSIVAEFDTNIDGSGLSTITGAKRRVLSIVTDGIGGIIPFTSYNQKGGRLKVEYDADITEFTGTTTTLVLKTFTAPPNTEIFGQISGNSGVGARAINYSYTSSTSTEKTIANIVTSITAFWNFKFQIDGNSQVYIRNTVVGSEGNTAGRIRGYYDERV